MSGLLPGSPSHTPLRLLPWEQVDWSVPLDYHMHTNHTDGTASVSQMAEAAQLSGMAEILFSEHIRHTSTYYPDFVTEVRAQKWSADGPGKAPVCCYVGFETKILDLHGRLDCPPGAAALSDALIGSVHNPPPSEAGNNGWSHMEPLAALDLEFELAMSIVARSRANILGHPLGIAITKFRLTPLEHLYRLACACRDSGTAFELNARYCSDPDAWIEIVRRAGCKVSFGSDAHKTSAVGTSWEIFTKRRLKL